MKVNEKITSLRKLMKEKNLDAYIIPTSDPHQSEYVPDYWKGREWISGFTGSAGTVVVTMKESGLWTDGRYFIQAEKELKSSEIKLYKMGQDKVPSINKYLEDQLESSSCVGFDGKLFSYDQVKNMKKTFKKKNIKINSSYDLIGELWGERPQLPNEKIFTHDVKYSGKSVKEKLEVVRKKMKEKNADFYVLSSLDDIAWLFNIRGRDIPCNPIAISYTLVSTNNATLFIDDTKLTSSVKEYLCKNGVEIKEYSDIKTVMEKLDWKSNIYLDSSKTSVWLHDSIPSTCEKIYGKDIVMNLKAIKNDIEIENFKKCQIRDGVAMVKFLCWLDKNIGKEKITELSVSEKLEEFRRLGENYIEPSFETISGYKDHGAIVHYSASEDSQYILKNEGMLLLDSGGQYLDGTTDITRTIVLGKVTEEEKRDFTLVLKGNISLSKAKFLYGTTGSRLDILARLPLWEQGLDFKHGTGHGVGYLLGVHEGPQRISYAHNDIKLEPGMLITNEPGLYKENKHGIRTENILLVTEDKKTEFGKFMKFEVTTFCPIDLNGVSVELLTEEEKRWLNEYHKDVYEKLSVYLNEEEKEWLKISTREV
ncbi:Xaa-pro aminopeptidase 1 [Gottschalkia acidurici 9a]|uniref:Xaa-pro aminopeptidase 1 n=1 Tax=Gottschalkia acidurici (strain ATCC 7906 / DSM 604 / BCRC 14475 / CIP 104303 / KCTC 5404 / NCIMB 10678 / 9a) TaxID=1128398 RepID=K0AW01_GOTA9|nr:aminopeptidase P family protein [Gottschalkia acidurici]AFS77424.1 Xaa-pro aminopeptidase 1 [Gottschalkia acidurici 9a]